MANDRTEPAEETPKTDNEELVHPADVLETADDTDEDDDRDEDDDEADETAAEESEKSGLV